MKKKRHFLAIALLAVFFCFLALVVTRIGAREPVYEGKPVSYWLRHSKKVPFIIGGTTVDYVEGYPKMDSKAVPFLEKALETRDGSFHRAYTNLWPKLPLWLQDRLSEPIEANEVRRHAELVFESMGLEAKGAVPALIHALRTDDDGGVRCIAAFALRTVGKGDERAEDGLIEGLRDKDRQVQVQSANSLAAVGKGDQRVTEALLGAIKDSDSDSQSFLRQVLQMIDPEAAGKAGVK